MPWTPHSYNLVHISSPFFSDLKLTCVGRMYMRDVCRGRLKYKGEISRKSLVRLNHMHGFSRCGLHAMNIGVGTGGAPGARTPPTNREWGQCPHSQNHAYSCFTRLDYEPSYDNSWNSSCKVCSDAYLHCYIQKTLADGVRAASRTQMGVVSLKSGRGSKIFARNYFSCPLNLQHLPTPM